MKKYKAYYSDGKTFEFYEGEKPPSRDIQAILQRNEENEIVIRSGGDFYVLKNGCWIEVDLFGLFDFLLDSGIVLFGRTISNTDYQNVMRHALLDREVFDG